MKQSKKDKREREGGDIEMEKCREEERREDRGLLSKGALPMASMVRAEPGQS